MTLPVLLTAPSFGQPRDAPWRLPDTGPVARTAEQHFAGQLPILQQVPLGEPQPEVREPDSSWWAPGSWFQPVDWEGGLEAGINGTTGNSETLNLRAGADVKRKTDLDEWSADLVYSKNSSDGRETQHYALLNSGYERFLFESPWTYFIRTQVEYDEFKAFDLRVAINSGLGYQFLDTETTSWKGRLGAGASREINGPEDSWTPEALLGTDYEWQISDRQKLASSIDYFPSWEDFSDYRLVTDVSWVILLDEARDLNLKLSLLNRFDSTPHGREPNDVNYALLLLWKL